MGRGLYNLVIILSRGDTLFMLRGSTGANMLAGILFFGLIALVLGSLASRQSGTKKSFMMFLPASRFTLSNYSNCLGYAVAGVSSLMVPILLSSTDSTSLSGEKYRCSRAELGVI